MTADEFAAEMVVSRETLERFESWRALLATWNARINLVAASTLSDFWRRHALDGAQLADLAPDTTRVWVDIGSGAGIPGLVAALMGLDRGWDAEVVLVEPIYKKASFLREAIRATGAPARVEPRRVQDLDGVSADVVTARAVAPLAQLLAMADGVWAAGTTGLFLKGREAAGEIDSAAAALKARGLRAERAASRSSVDGIVVRVRVAAPDS